MDVVDSALGTVGSRSSVDDNDVTWETVWRVLDTFNRSYDKGVWRALLDHVEPRVVCGLVREWTASASAEEAKFCPRPSVIASMWAARNTPAPVVRSRSYAGFRCWGCGRAHDPSTGNGLAHCPGCQVLRDARWQGVAA